MENYCAVLRTELNKRALRVTTILNSPFSIFNYCSHFVIRIRKNGNASVFAVAHKLS